MGGSSWSSEAYSSAREERVKAGTPEFAYHEHARTTGDYKAHATLDPKGIRRESRDSDAHPTSKAIAVLFDVTGSMGGIPRVLQSKLPGLMGVLLRKGYMDHPQVLFGAVGDATCDRVPLQIGQFESGVEMDADLRNLVLEGGGGPFIQESYELAMLFMARQVSMDCVEKRDEKAYLFIIGDEQAYPKASRALVEKTLGLTVQDDIPVETILEELQTKFEVFFIIPSNHGHAEVKTFWTNLLGQNVLSLDDPNAVCETIALAVGLCEGRTDLESGVKAVAEVTGGTGAIAAGRALAPLAARGAVARVSSGALPDIAGAEAAKRL
jgi:hypothetical protein